jgi:hypothetical protein
MMDSSSPKCITNQSDGALGVVKCQKQGGWGRSEAEPLGTQPKLDSIAACLEI